MPVTRQSPTGDPLADLSRRDRRSWRRTARTIQAQHEAAILAGLAGLHLQPVTGILTCPPCAVAITVTDWTITMAGVAPTACGNLCLLAACPCHLADSGRYGRFWWVAISSLSVEMATRTVLLGDRLTLVSTDGGRLAAKVPILPHLTADPC